MTSLTFDLIIYGFLLFDALVVAGFLIGWVRIGRKSFTTIPILVFLFMLLLGGIVAYGSFVEPKRIVVTEYSWKEIFEKAGRPELIGKMESIALISDFHLGPYKKKAWVAKVAQKLRELKPSPALIVITGDFISEEYEVTDDFEPLREVRTANGIFGVLGNHDYGEALDDLRNDEGLKRTQKLKETLEKIPRVKILVNESVEIPPLIHWPDRYVIGGVDEIWTLNADIEKTFRGFPDDGKLKILVAHNPDVILEAKKYPIDVVLAGHTHAGQIRLPLWGSIPQIPDLLGNAYDEGVFYFDRFDGKKIPLVITRGLGESGPRARLFAPPEIVLLE